MQKVLILFLTLLINAFSTENKIRYYRFHINQGLRNFLTSLLADDTYEIKYYIINCFVNV